MAKSSVHRIIGAFAALGLCILCYSQAEFDPIFDAELESRPAAVGDYLADDGIESIVDSIHSEVGVDYASLLMHDALWDEFAYGEVWSDDDSGVSFVVVTSFATGESEWEWFNTAATGIDSYASSGALFAAPKVDLKPFIDAIMKWWSKPKPTPKPATTPAPKVSLKPTPNFQPPTNPPQLPPTTVPPGHRVRQMPPTQQYPNGYWKLEKQLPGGNWQPINPSTMKPGTRPETYVPFPGPNPPTNP